MSLENWRGQNLSIDFYDRTLICGRNRSGKSTIFNAWLWLLTGTDSDNRMNFELFDNTVARSYENSLPASVEAEMTVDGMTYVFKKTAKEGWVRKRGQSTYERKGADDYKFFIDGIEVPAGKYYETIEGLFAPMDKLKLMLNIQYFMSLNWKDMRKQFQDIVGDITDEDFHGDYSLISDDLQRYTTDELKERYKALKKTVDGNISALTTKVEVLKSALPDTDGVDIAEERLSLAMDAIKTIDAEICDIDKRTEAIMAQRKDAMNEISDLETLYANSRREYMRAYEDEMSALTSKLKSIQRDNADIMQRNAAKNRDIARMEKELEQCKAEVARLNDYRKVLLKKNADVKAMTFNESECPYCGQALPDTMLEEKRKQFNDRKEKERAAVVAEGKSNNIRIENTQAKIKQLEEALSQGYEPAPLLDTDALTKEMDALKKEFVPWENTPTAQDIMAKIGRKKDEMAIVQIPSHDELTDRKNLLLEEVQKWSKAVALKEERRKQEEIIEATRKELAYNAIEAVRLEGLLSKVKEYEDEKADIISCRVNDKFTVAQVQMFEINKSGDYIPSCVIMDDTGVKVNVTNTASRISCGVDLSLVFQKSYGLSLPLFIDNAECLNASNMPRVDDGQVIALSVSESALNVSELN